MTDRQDRHCRSHSEWDEARRLAHGPSSGHHEAKPLGKRKDRPDARFVLRGHRSLAQRRSRPCWYGRSPEVTSASAATLEHRRYEQSPWCHSRGRAASWSFIDASNRSSPTNVKNRFPRRPDAFEKVSVTLDPDDGVGLHGVRTSRVRRDWRDDAPFEPLVALLGRRLIGHRELGRTRAAVAPRRGPSASSSGPPATHASTPASLCRRDG